MSSSSKDATSSRPTPVLSNNPLPRLELPDPICSNVPGTWAYDTMSRRVDSEILHRTALDNQEAWSSDPAFAPVLAKFQQLRQELQNAADTKLSYLDDDNDNNTANDNNNNNSAERIQEAQEWRQLLQPYIENGDTWLTAPWMVTEFYVYRRLMQALRYWDRTSPGFMYDPFAKPKRDGLVSSVASAEAVLAQFPKLLLPTTTTTNTTTDDNDEYDQGIGLAASFALWGNKMDLSLWPADASGKARDVFSAIWASASENLLHDDTALLAQHCARLRRSQGGGGGNVDIIVDNAGLELVTDLALGQYLIQSGIAARVTFQLKSHPTFVSDALEKDLRETVAYYHHHLDPAVYPHAQAAGAVWQEYLDQGKWQCHEDNFWVQPYAMWDMTEPLRSDLVARVDLAFVKGDANYRRLLGDRQWDWTAPFQDVVGAYFPCPVCALRTLKAELGCGMDAAQIARAQSLDDEWMVNGRFGVVQFGTGCGDKSPKASS